MYRLNIGYIDILLIHAPIAPGILGTYDAMLDMKERGFIRWVKFVFYCAHYIKTQRQHLSFTETFHRKSCVILPN